MGGLFRVIWARMALTASIFLPWSAPLNLINRPPIDTDYQLSDRFRRNEGRVFLTGTQALVRILLAQASSELNGVAIKQNKQAFALGRVAVADPTLGAIAAPERQSPSLDQIIERRAAFLVDYQNEKLADSL